VKILKPFDIVQTKYHSRLAIVYTCTLSKATFISLDPVYGWMFGSGPVENLQVPTKPANLKVLEEVHVLLTDGANTVREWAAHDLEVLRRRAAGSQNDTEKSKK